MRSRTDLELACFETDRNVVVRQLRTVAKAIEESAREMKMIGLEQVFDQRLSKVLSGEAQALERIARGLNSLGQKVARARLSETRKSSGTRKRRG